MATYTTNYNLKKPDETENYNVADFNDNADTVDAKLKELENKSAETDSALSDASTNPVQNKVIKAELDKKVDKADGKGLSTNDYTTEEKNKLAGIAAGANKTVVDDALSDTSTNPVQNKIVKAALDEKAASTHEHSADDITSGTLPVTRGGTGATAPTTARVNLGFTYGTEEPSSAPSTGAGSVYFMEDDGTPTPISEGGTGATTVEGILANLGIADYVIEQGTSGIWEYEKRNSGIAECWCDISLSSIASTATWNNMQVYNRTISLPSGLFVEIPIINPGRTYWGTGYVIGSVVRTATTESFLWYVFGSTSSGDILVQFHAKGKWK